VASTLLLLPTPTTENVRLRPPLWVPKPFFISYRTRAKFTYFKARHDTQRQRQRDREREKERGRWCVGGGQERVKDEAWRISTDITEC